MFPPNWPIKPPAATAASMGSGGSTLLPRAAIAAKTGAIATTVGTALTAETQTGSQSSTARRNALAHVYTNAENRPHNVPNACGSTRKGVEAGLDGRECTTGAVFRNDEFGIQIIIS